MTAYIRGFLIGIDSSEPYLHHCETSLKPKLDIFMIYVINCQYFLLAIFTCTNLFALHLKKVDLVQNTV